MLARKKRKKERKNACAYARLWYTCLTMQSTPFALPCQSTLTPRLQSSLYQPPTMWAAKEVVFETENPNQTLVLSMFTKGAIWHQDKVVATRDFVAAWNVYGYISTETGGYLPS